MITIQKSGILATIQDIGRFGYAQYGIITSGAMDKWSMQVANILVGNERHEAVIEVTLGQTAMTFHTAAVIAVYGADLQAMRNDAPLPLGRPIQMHCGDRLSFGYSKKGCRAYIAVRGGIDVPTIMNSKSTYLRAQFGGYKGRALKKGDTLHISSHTLHTDRKAFYPLRQICSSIRVLPHVEQQQFTETSQDAFFHHRYTIARQADRMGYRLKGPILTRNTTQEMLSEAVLEGTIQVANDGQLVILLADHQTTGGYPRIGQVAAVDIPLLAQLKPGDTLQFQPITLDDAIAALRKEQQALRRLEQAMQYEP